jgi:hypothetical protein
MCSSQSISLEGLMNHSWRKEIAQQVGSGYVRRKTRLIHHVQTVCVVDKYPTCGSGWTKLQSAPARSATEEEWRWRFSAEAVS